LLLGAVAGVITERAVRVDIELLRDFQLRLEQISQLLLAQAVVEALRLARRMGVLVLILYLEALLQPAVAAVMVVAI
jgi:hypothetical protein